MRQINPGEKNLQRKREEGRLIWRDPEPLPAMLFGPGYFRKVPLGRRRHDFTEDVLQRWAKAGNLFERLN